jgi:hypothetical protein
MRTRIQFAVRVLAFAATLMPVWTFAQSVTPVQPAQRDQPAPSADGFKIGDFTFKPGGYVKLDIIRDFNPIGSEDFFDTRTIPVDGSEGVNSNIHAKESRLSLDVRGMVEGKQLRVYFETDFYGSNSVMTLRHAYGSYGGLLAGHTWTTFVDEDNLPPTIDFEAPTAFAKIRQAQLRWTQKLGSTVTWSAAVEDNKSTITPPAGVAGKAEYPTPDLVTRFRFDIPHGHVTTAGFYGTARFRPTGGETDSVPLWGAVASAKFRTVGKDFIYGILTTGKGIGRYRGGTTAVPDENGRLHAVAGNAYMGGYQHYWTDRVTSNALYSLTDTIDEPFYTSSANKQLLYGSANVIYWFLPDRAWFGAEYIYGHREVFGGDAEGHAHRIQFAVRFGLP